MAGHVYDGRLSHLELGSVPPATLRSALRLLVSQGSITQRPFVEHVRTKFFDNPPPFVAPRELFPGDYIVAPACLAYLAQTRCIFSCKLAQESLPYLEHFLGAILRMKVRWGDNSELAAVLAKFDGDVVQAIQALKESRPDPSPKLLSSLNKLLASLKSCEEYCKGDQHQLPFPFTRSRRQLKDVIAILFPENNLAPEGAKHEVILIPNHATEKPAVETFRLGPFEVPRLFNGLWQVSSPSWGSGTATDQEIALAHAVSCGLTAADMADHYGDAELIYGEFRNKLAPEVRNTVYAATKWCIFSPISTPITTSFVLDAVRERCRRLGGRVELLQFHWQNYNAKEYLDILVELLRITKSHPELVSSIGLCNFDAEHVAELCEYLIVQTGEVGIVSNQVQFSLIDARPLEKMVQVCDQHGLKLLTYGSFCGGFLSERWLGRPAPAVYLESYQLTPSQRKYFDMIQTWDSWTSFQALLSRLSTVAHKHGVSISNIATRWVLQQPAVGAVIVGTRLGVSDHVEDNLKVFGFELDSGDMDNINAVALGSEGEKVKALFNRLGDCGNEYRKLH